VVYLSFHLFKSNLLRFVNNRNVDRLFHVDPQVSVEVCRVNISDVLLKRLHVWTAVEAINVKHPAVLPVLPVDQLKRVFLYAERDSAEFDNVSGPQHDASVFEVFLGCGGLGAAGLSPTLNLVLLREDPVFDH
jgi:hypothetical protein